MTRPRLSSILSGTDAPGLTGWPKFHADLARERARDLVHKNTIAQAVHAERERLRLRKRGNLGAKAVEKVAHRVRI